MSQLVFGNLVQCNLRNISTANPNSKEKKVKNVTVSKHIMNHSTDALWFQFHFDGKRFRIRSPIGVTT